ncbi:peptide chain release factor H [Flavipsychrobacter stenotrophus]|uniref:Peptide chain release factor H n=1 Tax=Flavipsychrobacter stenotrophus TaxID=2077091 RepID=A0A2S7SWB5_9BACT|nr:peptide chain release factor H [Flavipsychrobacter stenotrophus]PQJ10816.1 peptide chain release factor H [Flavipsychrobacter stenotrophus]
MDKIIIQITSGRGPVECCRVVARLQEMMLKQAKQYGITFTVLSNTKGELAGTLQSAVIQAEGNTLSAFTKEWQGTVQWIAQSPYRKMHKRKNWFAGVEIFDPMQQLKWNINDVRLDTCRSSGPGGQNVNKVETAVRGTHIPSGIQVLASDSRSQLQNKKLCLERLEAKVLAWQTTQLTALQQTQWQEHNILERGNPVKVIQQPL